MGLIEWAGDPELPVIGPRRDRTGSPMRREGVTDLPPGWQTSEIKTHPKIKVRTLKMDPNNKKFDYANVVIENYALPLWLTDMLDDIAAEQELDSSEVLVNIVCMVLTKPVWELPTWLHKAKTEWDAGK